VDGGLAVVHDGHASRHPRMNAKELEYIAT
jgi:hypothetical protein